MKKLISAVLCFFAVVSLAPRAHALGVSAESAVLREAESGNIIYEKNAHVRRGMASTTKIMTALLALEMLNPDENIVVDDRAVGIEGSSIYLKNGECMSVIDLIYSVCFKVQTMRQRHWHIKLREASRILPFL